MYISGYCVEMVMAGVAVGLKVSTRNTASKGRCRLLLKPTIQTPSRVRMARGITRSLHLLPGGDLNILTLPHILANRVKCFKVAVAKKVTVENNPSSKLELPRRIVHAWHHHSSGSGVRTGDWPSCVGIADAGACACQGSISSPV